MLDEEALVAQGVRFGKGLQLVNILRELASDLLRPARPDLKAELAGSQPYQEWLNKTQIPLDKLPTDVAPMTPPRETLLDAQQAFGYSQEDIKFLLTPMVLTGQEAVGSMGADNPPSVLSSRSKHLSTYFKQNFAQVTNPAIDSIREEIIMSLECYIGPERNLLTTTAEHAHRLRIPHPILTNEEVRALKTIDERGWRSKLIDITWPRADGPDGLEATLQRVQASQDLHTAAPAAGGGLADDLAVGEGYLAAADDLHLLVTLACHHHQAVLVGPRQGGGDILGGCAKWE